MTVTSPTHMERIRAGIWDIHEGVAPGSGAARPAAPAENDVMGGTLPRFRYVNSLGQRYLLQRGFEEVLAAARENSDFVAAVVTDEQFHADKAAADLRFFGVDPASVSLLSETREMIAFFRETALRDVRLVMAVHYVIEGSNNGAMFIAKAVKKAYGLEGTDGTFHLQPYGPAIRDRWRAFGEAFNALPIDDELMEEMVRVGRETFHRMNAVMAAAYRLPEAEA